MHNAAKRVGNAYIGERVHTLMWRTGRSQRQLAEILNVDQGSVSNRLRGKTQWSALELLAVATWLDVPVTDLLPDPDFGGTSLGVEGQTPPLTRGSDQPTGWAIRHVIWQPDPIKPGVQPFACA